MERKKILAKFGPWVLALFVLMVVYLLRGVLTPFLLAALVAYILDPAVTRMERRMSRGVAVGLLTVALLLILSILVPLLSYRVAKEAVNFAEAIPGYATDLGQQISGEKESRLPEWLRRSFREALAQWEVVLSPPSAPPPSLAGTVSEEPPGEEPALDETSGQEGSGAVQTGQNPLWVLLKAFQSEQAGDVAKKVSKGTIGAIGWTASLFINTFIFFVVTVYLLKDFPKMIAFFRSMVPRHYDAFVAEVVGEIDRHLRSFFQGALTVCSLLTIIYLVGLLVIGVPFSYVISVVAGFANIIPYCGPFIGATLSLTVGWFTFHSGGKLLAIGLLFLVAQILDNTVLTPKIVGGRVGLNPVLVIFAIMACGRFLGFFGVLLAVPIAACTKVILSVAVKRYRESAVFTGGDDSPSG